MLICQEMFLLLTKDNGKKEDWVSNNEAAPPYSQTCCWAGT